MKGYFEKSPQEVAAEELLESARRYAGTYLISAFSEGTLIAGRELLAEAIAYVETVPVKRKKKVKE